MAARDWKWVAGALAAFGVIVAVGLAVEDKPAPRPVAAKPGPAIMTRDAFLAACRVDRQIEACTRSVGSPDSRQSGSSGMEAWYYRGRTFDPVTMSPDWSVQVIVEHGVVTGINFN